MAAPKTLEELNAVLRDIEARHRTALDEVIERLKNQQLDRLRAELERTAQPHATN